MVFVRLYVDEQREASMIQRKSVSVQGAVFWVDGMHVCELAGLRALRRHHRGGDARQPSHHTPQRALRAHEAWVTPLKKMG